MRLNTASINFSNTDVYKPIYVVILIILVISMRFYNLEADTPLKIGSNIGAYVDEGYKTLGPRNLYLYGKTHWNPNDDYPTWMGGYSDAGWMGRSPVTQWAYFLSFKLLGNDIKSVRTVSILFYSAFLIVFAILNWKRSCNPVYLFSLFLIGTESIQFFYSRIAIFEMPIEAILYITLFTLFYFDKKKSYFYGLLFILVVTFVVTFFVKKSGIIYFVPLIFGAVIEYFINNPLKIYKKNNYYYILAGLISIGLIGIYTADVWMDRLSVKPVDIISRLIQYKLIYGTPYIVIAGLLVTIHGLFCCYDDFTKGVYRKSLILLIFIVPLLLALFRAPFRFYVPLIPAYILILIEWINMKAWRYSVKSDFKQKYYLLSILLFLMFFYIGVAINNNFLIYFKLGDDPGISAKYQNIIFSPISILLVLIVLTYRRIFLSKELVSISLIILLFLHFSQSAYRLSSFFYSPIYQRKTIKENIDKIIQPGQSVTGDWAPILTLGTTIKTLYSDRNFNNGGRVLTLKPDYFLYTNSEDSKIWLQQFSKINGINLGEIIYDSEYAGKKVSLYPIIYANE